MARRQNHILSKDAGRTTGAFDESEHVVSLCGSTPEKRLKTVLDATKRWFASFTRIIPPPALINGLSRQDSIVGAGTCSFRVKERFLFSIKSPSNGICCPHLGGYQPPALPLLWKTLQSTERQINPTSDLPCLSPDYGRYQQ